ncbi:MAG TPA: HD domain-containing phosphohydrolase, partial [Rhodocyclaceae bacterium]|nr:HD domain-containing phosphohydrolase [Rhodocyclaceae bacterium]
MEIQSEFIDVDQLRIGHFIFMDLGWMSHPFPLNSFRIQSENQISTIRSLGIRRIRYSPGDSLFEPPPREATCTESPDHTRAGGNSGIGAGHKAAPTEPDVLHRNCERLFNDASRAYRQLTDQVRAKPADSRLAAQTLVADVVDRLAGDQETCLRLLSETAGERMAMHAVNVMVIALLLGKASGMDELMLHELGIGALLHDIGKIDLPDRLRQQDDNASAAERNLYREHVAYGVACGSRMQLEDTVLKVIGQHHEQADGSGFPLGLKNDRLVPAARVVALVNRYDNLCNPGNPALSLTPHEALSRIYSQSSGRFDGVVMNTFVRMMGVYPPGSLVQLSDDRYALVISVSPSRPLKPRVIIHTPG